MTDSVPFLFTDIDPNSPLVRFYREKGINSIMCIGIPYLEDTRAIVVVQSSLDSPRCWKVDEMTLLQEASVQGNNNNFL